VIGQIQIVSSVESNPVRVVIFSSEEFAGPHCMYDIFFIKGILHHIAIMGYTINCVERTDNRDFASQPSSPVLEPEKNKELPVPTQGDSSVDDYCSIFHIYLVASGKVEDGKIGDAEVGEAKEKFIRGLSPAFFSLDSKKECLLNGLVKNLHLTG
jgi:hypothetical protein